MAEPLSRDRLSQLAEEAAQIAEICDAHGETAGRTAARSQQRAFEAELVRRGPARG